MQPSRLARMIVSGEQWRWHVHIERTIDINAPIQSIWDITLDIERWPEWTASMKSIRKRQSGPISIGSVAQVEPNGGVASDWTVSELQAPNLFAWETRVRGVRVVGRHRMQETPGGTRMTLELDYSGLLARLFNFQIRRTFVHNLEVESQGMKKFAEGLAQT